MKITQTKEQYAPPMCEVEVVTLEGVIATSGTFSIPDADSTDV